MISKTYDVIIVGCGVGGLFSAYTLANNNKHILILEKGKTIEDR